MGKGIPIVETALIVGAAGVGGAYFLDLGGAKGTIDGLIAEIMAAMTLGGGGGGTDPCLTNPDDPACAGGGGGIGCDDPNCTSACCKCKCKDRTNCPEDGTCCDKCGEECPGQCAGQSASSLIYPNEGDAELPIPDPPHDLQHAEPYGAGGLGPIAFGGYNFPNNEAFFNDEFDPVENSVGGFRTIMTQYVMPVPNSNTTMHTRQTSRKMEDGIQYHLG